jgi:guanine deaminase
LVEAGRIVGVQREAPGEAFERIASPGLLLTPGLVDAHVHMPQLEVIASHGTELLQWLERHTFPAEARYADPAVCREGASVFVNALLAHGTTSAAVFPTVHAASLDALMQEGVRRGMALGAGKCLMDRHAPAALLDTVDAARSDLHAHIERWHGHERLRHTVTVRFAPTSSAEQLRMASQVLERHPGMRMQTHLAETHDELAWVAKLFPHCGSYLDVYAQHGLLHGASKPALMGHGIHLNDNDRRQLAQAHAVVVHCPSSNLFLGSGLMDWRAHEAQGVAVVLGSDVGGGTSLSMLRTMADAARVQALTGSKLTAFKALHACTAAAASAVGFEPGLGTLEPGSPADLTLWHWAVGDVAKRRDALAVQHEDLHERLYAWMMQGDAANVAQVWVAGRPVMSALQA